MFELFFPDEIKKSVYQINFRKLYSEGYRGIIFDIDNTLVEHGADASKRAKRLFIQLKEIGFSACLLSNNKKERVDRFNQEIHIYSIFKAGKPKKKGYLKALELMGTTKTDTIFIGDQLFTDVWGAKRIGIRNILVNPINQKEEIQIVLKRYLERIVLYFYYKKKEKKIKL